MADGHGTAGGGWKRVEIFCFFDVSVSLASPPTFCFLSFFVMLVFRR